MSWGADRDELGEVIPVLASAKRRPGSQGAAWRRAVTRRPPPAPIGEEEDDRRSSAGPGKREVRVFPFFSDLFLFCYFINLLFISAPK